MPSRPLPTSSGVVGCLRRQHDRSLTDTLVVLRLSAETAKTTRVARHCAADTLVWMCAGRSMACAANAHRTPAHSRQFAVFFRKITASPHETGAPFLPSGSLKPGTLVQEARDHTSL